MSELEDLIFWSFMRMFGQFLGFLRLFEAITAYIRPQSSDLTSDLKFVAQMVYDTTFVWAV